MDEKLPDKLFAVLCTLQLNIGIVLYVKAITTATPSAV